MASKVKDNVRVNIYMNAGILEKLDEHAEKLGLSRSSAISVIVYEYFRTENASEAMARMNQLDLFKIIAERQSNA